MKKILNKILRNDLDLNKYWWHRLFKVAFLIILIATIIITAYITWENNNRYRKPYNNKDYFEITSTLSDYISKHSGKTLVKIEKMLEDDTYVVDKERFEDEEYKI
jgi:predicted negative regulator of RcsB-dependent stress response